MRFRQLRGRRTLHAVGRTFPLEASQFEVVDQRPFEAILGEHLR